MTKKYFFLLIPFVLGILAACVTHFRATDLQYDGRIGKDTIVLSSVAFVARRKRFNDRIGSDVIDNSFKRVKPSVSQVRQMSPLEQDELLQLLIDPEVPSYVHSDMWLQLNLTRLQNSSPGIVQLVQQRLSARSDSGRGFSDSVSADDIVSAMSSRRIQTASELRAFADQMAMISDNVKSRLESAAVDPSVSTSEPASGSE